MQAAEHKTANVERAGPVIDALRQAPRGRAPVVLATSDYDAPDLGFVLGAALPESTVITVTLTPRSTLTDVLLTIAERTDPLLPAADRIGNASSTSDAMAAVWRVAGRDERRRLHERVRRALSALDARERGGRSLGAVLLVQGLEHAPTDLVECLEFLITDALRPAPLAVIGRPIRRAALVLTVASATPGGSRTLSQLALALDGATRVAVADAAHEALQSDAVRDRLARLAGSRPHGANALLALLPESLDELFALRLGALPPEVHQVLLAAQLVGRELPAAALAELSDTSRFVVDRARRERLLDESGRSVALPEWAIEPPVTVDGPLRVAIANRAADYLRSIYATTGDAAALLRVASLWQECGAPVSVDAVLNVADLLFADRAWADAYTLLGQLEPSRLPLVDRVRVHLALARVEAARGAVASALSHLRSAGACRSASADLAPASVEHALAEVRLAAWVGEHDAALAVIDQLRLRLSDDAAALADVDAEAAEVHLRQGQLDRAAECALRVVALPGSVARARALHVQGKVAYWRADYAAARDAFGAALAAVGLDERRLRATIHHNLGLIDLKQGRYDDACRVLELAFADFDTHGDEFQVAVCLHNLAVAYEYAQRYRLVAPALERAIDLHDRFGTTQSGLGAITTLGDFYAATGELWRARRLLDYALKRSNDAGLAYEAAFAQLKLAEVHRLEGTIDVARQLATDASAAFSRMGHQGELAETRLLLGLLGDTASLALAVQSGTPELRLRATVALSVSRGGDLDDAILAATDLESLGQRPAAIQAHQSLVLAFESTGRLPEAHHHHSRAKSLLDALRREVPPESLENFDALVWVDSVTAWAPRAVTPTEPPSGPARRWGSIGKNIAPLVPVASERRALAPGDALHPSVVGDSPAVLRVLNMVDRVAPSDAPILIAGESGTGKELIADALWRKSRRHGKPFIRVNAAAFADSLLESELFGHEKGAFTGAVSRKLGAFEQANGGTLFLDEIGDISPKTQVSLLRVLQSGEVRRVGGTEAVHVDVRVITATHRDLDAMVVAGDFRLDLVYRIRGVQLTLPPLRERMDDLDALCSHILGRLGAADRRHVTLSPDARSLMTAHRWPGNVRELENVLRSAYFFAQNGVITASDLTAFTTLKVRSSEPSEFDDIVSEVDPSGDALPGAFDLNEAKRQLEIRCIERAFDQAGGNISKAAQLLGLKRPRLSQKIKEYGLKEPG
ncbi:MAG: sigma 54-interacting transcriptional regulator [Myxococcales bacterium]|nr:sigma 54-interacting transcriptional regulator [Myxococcales bacterium]